MASDNITNHINADSRELAKFAYALGQEKTNIQQVNVARDHDSAQVALIPAGLVLTDLKPLIPQVPEIKEVDLKLRDVKSFCEYVNEQKESFTRIFAQVENPPYTFKAIIDWHGTYGMDANWCQHICTLALDTSQEFKTWQKKNGEMFRQAEFAEFLKDNRLDITQPNGADLLQLVMNLEATQENRVVGKLPTNAGTRLSFEQDTRSSVAGQSVTIPDKITLSIPFFVGTKPETLEADFKFRIKEGTIWFGYRLLGIDRMVRESVLSCSAAIREATQTPVYI